MFFFFIILLFLIKQFSFNFFNSQEYNIYLNINNSEYSNKIIDCVEKYSNISKKLLNKCIINETKHDIDGLIEILNNKTMLDEFKIIVKDEIVERVLTELEISEALLNDIKDSLRYKDNLNLTLLDYIEIIDNNNNKPANYDIIFGCISKILEIESVRKVIKYFMDNKLDLFINITEKLIANFDDLYNVFNASMSCESFDKNKTKIIPSILNILMNFNNKTKARDLIIDFVITYRDVINDLLKNKEFTNKTKTLLKNQNNILNLIIYSILDKQEVQEQLSTLLNFQDIFNKVMNLFINLDNITYVLDELPSFLYDIKSKSKYFLLNFIRNLLLRAVDYNSREVFLGIYQNALREFFISHEINNYTIDETCLDFFRNTFFNNAKTKEFTLKNLKKFLVDSPINKGDFLGFDNCLEEIKGQEDFGDSNYTLTSAFIIGIFDFNNKSLYMKTTYFEKYYYVSNFCFPLGYTKNISTGKDDLICKESDYAEMLKFFYDLLPKSNDTNIIPIIMYKNNVKLENKDYFIGIISLVFLALPLLIGIGLKISECIIKKKNKEDQKINKLIDDKKSSKISINNENEAMSIKKTNLSKCHIILKKCFNFYNNGRELFNFNLNNTNFNNINGITYIKGLIGLSIIINIFGITFTNLMNANMKDFGIWHFYKTNHSFFLVFFVIGYRFSSRILFSCSGYTLVYKYLCFLEQEKGLYFLKFVFLQSYKYLFLYISLFFFRYSVVRIIYLFRREHRPIWRLFEHFLEHESFLSTAFYFLFDYSNFNTKERKQNLIYSFYMPINEIFFFLIGTIIISIGYKCKLRIDIFIIITILCFFIAKIIIYIIFSKKNENSYLTIDYYSLNYGIVTLNPLYNISYFLIGMYFGLINYAIQKGITNIYKENQYKKYYQLEESNTKKEENEENSLLSPINDNNELIKDNKENNDDDNVNKMKDENLDKYLSTKENNLDNNINKQEKELIEQIKDMPFLKSPIQFYNLNKKYKEHILYNVLIFVALALMIALCYSKNIFIAATSELGDFKNDMDRADYRFKISLEDVISNIGLNILNILDIDIIVFLSHWIIFLLFFKESTIIREFCNSRYWSFFVKSYYSYLLVSVPIILCIIHESESIIKIHAYNFMLLSLITILYIFVFMVLFYSVFELPIKRIFKSLLKRNEIIEEEEEEEEEDDNDDDKGKNEKDEENEPNIIFDDDDEDETKTLKN